MYIYKPTFTKGYQIIVLRTVTQQTHLVLLLQLDNLRQLAQRTLHAGGFAV